MGEPELTPFQLGRLRTLQIIVGALILGNAVFLGIVNFVVHSRGKPLSPPEDIASSTLFAECFAVLAVINTAWLPRWVATTQRRQNLASHDSKEMASDAGKLASIFLTTNIIGVAFLEAAGFFASLAFLLEAEWITAVIAGLIVLGLAWSMPTRGQLQRWLEFHLGELEGDRRQMGGSPPA